MRQIDHIEIGLERLRQLKLWNQHLLKVKDRRFTYKGVPEKACGYVFRSSGVIVLFCIQDNDIVSRLQKVPYPYIDIIRRLNPLFEVEGYDG